MSEDVDFNKKHDLIIDKVKELCERHPEVIGDYRKLIQYYHYYVDGFKMFVPMEVLERLTQPESVTRAYRKLVEKGIVDPDAKVKFARNIQRETKNIMEEPKMILRAYRFRLYPNKAQTETMNHHLWLSKELWNRMLETTKNRYKTEKKFPTKKELREIVKRQGLYSQVGQELVDRLLEAVWRFIELKKQGVKCGFPRFKSFDRLKSLIYPQLGFKLEGKRLKVTPFGSVNIKLTDP